jgi:hypothetical protein
MFRGLVRMSKVVGPTGFPTTPLGQWLHLELRTVGIDLEGPGPFLSESASGREGVGSFLLFCSVGTC